MSDELSTHSGLAERLRSRLFGEGLTDPSLRKSIVERVSAGEPLAAPYEVLVDRIAEGGYRVTDPQVAAVRESVGSEKAAFEVVLAASVTAGLQRWDAAARSIREATDATA